MVFLLAIFLREASPRSNEAMFTTSSNSSITNVSNTNIKTKKVQTEVKRRRVNPQSEPSLEGAILLMLLKQGALRN